MIIDAEMAAKIVAATMACPRHTNANPPTTAAQPTPSSMAVRNSFHNALSSRRHTTGPSVSP